MNHPATICLVMETGANFELGLPNLQLGELIAAGGFGRVYRGYDTFLRRPLAIKILRTTTGLEVRSLFEAEAAAHGPLSRHPNIVTLHHAGFTTNGAEPYLVMDYIEGGSLAEYLAESGPVPWQHVVAWMIPICSAVQHVHDHGILHRDIKPDNILLDPPSTPLLSDLGIACLQADTSPLPALSLGHVAPEALRGESTGTASDVYSLGSTIYQLLTGRLPFGGDLQDRLANLQADPPPIPAELFIPPWLNEGLVACLARDPAARLQTSGELEKLLRQATSQLDLRSPTIPTRAIPIPESAPIHEPVTASTTISTAAGGGTEPPSANPPAIELLPGLRPAPNRRSRLARAVGAVAMVLIAVAGAVLAWPGHETDDASADHVPEAAVGDPATSPTGGTTAGDRSAGTAPDGTGPSGGSVPGDPASASAISRIDVAPGPIGQGAGGNGATPATIGPGETGATATGSTQATGSAPQIDNGSGNGGGGGSNGGGGTTAPPPCTAVVVPTVVNLSVADARKALESAGFRTTQGSAQDSYLAQSTDPAARASGCKGDTVRIDACAGTRVPVVDQKSEQEARLAMAGASLVVSVSYVDSAAVGPGLVVGTSPAARTPICVDSKVTLTVSSGSPVCFVVPNVIGMPQEQARSTLEQASPYIYVLVDHGFTPRPAGGDIGAVFFQSLPGGTKVTACDYTSVGITVRAGYVPGS